MTTRIGSALARLLAILLASTSLPAAADEPVLEYSLESPADIVGAERCGECHLSALQVWKQTAHATGFQELHRKENAQAIAERLGYRLLKRDSLCLRCHYTSQVSGDELRAVAGVSCESCHGAAREWIDVHNDYGGKGVNASSETAEHRTRRIAGARAAGMRRPSDLYELASSCYDCHLAPIERLVNVGGHSTGSGDFELMSWTQGKIRHNFLDSFLHGDGTVNAEQPIEHRRLLYVVGRGLELEHALRGVAAASEEGVYLKAMIRRVRNATAELREIESRVPEAELARMLEAVRGVRVGLGSSADLRGAAAQVAEASRELLNRSDATQLAAIDPLMLGTETPALASADVSSGVGESADRAAAESAAEPPPAGERAAGTATAASGPAASRAENIPAQSPSTTTATGAIKSRLRPASTHATVGPGACSSCHAKQNQWWYDDVHYTSAEPFFDEESKNVQIARLYGIRPTEMTRGTALCMDCHGTIVAGKEQREVLDGVSCESCHGPARDWLEVHKEGEGLGRARPAFQRSLELGKRDLRQLELRARVCGECHYVTEPRLLSAGHPSGAAFDYLGGLAKTRHWEHELEPVAQLRATYATALEGRGPVPEVAIATLAVAAAPAGGATPRQTTRGEETARPASAAGEERVSHRLAFAGAGQEGTTEVVQLEGGELAPWPELDETVTVEELLLLVKQRLELLYRLVGKPAAP